MLDAYTLVVASLVMFAGSTSDRFGRRRIFQIGLGLFTGYWEPNILKRKMQLSYYRSTVVHAKVCVLQALQVILNKFLADGFKQTGIIVLWAARVG